MGDRINVGCGNYPLADHTNIDLVPPADVVGDFLGMRFTDVEHVEMSHVLEHVSWRRTGEALTVVAGWLAPGGTVRIEVPDMTALCEFGTRSPFWELGIFGAQIHEGEFHQAGFSVESLVNKVARSGLVVTGVRTFRSEHRERVGFPCIELRARAPG